MTDILVCEGPGIEVLRRITHHGYFFGHYDTEIEESQLPASEIFDPSRLSWPRGTLVLRIMHRITRVRKIWNEEFPGDVEWLKSRQIYTASSAVVVSDRKELRQYARTLRDFDDAHRLLSLGNIQGIIVDPQKKIWAKLRQNEHAARSI